METGLLHDYFGNFPCEVKDIIFAWRGACEVRLKRTSEMEGGGEIETNIRKLRRVEGGIKLAQIW